MTLSILSSISSQSIIMLAGSITSASFSTPSILGTISITNITGKYKSFTVSRTGGGLSNYTSSVINSPTNSFTDPTVLINNAQYTYTINPNYDIAGTAFSAITNPTTTLSNGLIYTLATTSGLSPVYNGAGSATNVASFTFTGTNNGTTNNYKNLSIQYPNGTAVSTPNFLLGSNTFTSTATLNTNTQYLYYIYVVNGDNLTNTTSITINTCTRASPPTLAYNNAGCSTTAISFTYSGGTFTSLSIQTTLGTQITTITTSPYTGGTYSANSGNITYYACPVNALGYYSTTTNYATVIVGTWARVISASATAVSSVQINVSCSGTFPGVYITRSGGSTKVATANTITNQPMTGLSPSTLYTFYIYPYTTVNGVQYPSSAPTYGTTSGVSYNNSASATTQSSGPPTPNLIIQYIFNSSYYTSSRLKNVKNNAYDLNLQTATLTTIAGINCLNCNGSFATVDTAVTNNALTFINSSTSVAAVTITFWAYRTTTQATAGLWEWKLASNFNGTEMEFQIDAGNVVFYFTNGGQYPNVGSIVSSTWAMYSIVILTSGSYITYKNNSQTLSGTCNANQLNITRDTFLIGRNTWGDPNFTGYIADFRLYNYQLTLAQIQTQYSTGAANV